MNTPTASTPDAAVHRDDESLTALRHADDVLLAKLGYKSVFKREFSVSVLLLIFYGLLLHVLCLLQFIETIAFAFSIMGVVASVSSTLSFPLVSGMFQNHDRANIAADNVCPTCRRSCRHGIWLADTLYICHVHCGMLGRIDVLDAVRILVLGR